MRWRRYIIKMKGIMRRGDKLAVFVVVAVTVFLIYMYQTNESRQQIIKNFGDEPQTLRDCYTEWPPFNSKLKHDREWYRDFCFNSQFTEDVEEVFTNLIPVWSESEYDACKDVYEKFVSLFEVHDRHSRKIELPPPFLNRVTKWFNGDKNLLEQIHHQHLIHVFQPLTSEHVVYNPVRAKRPMPSQDMNIYEWVDKISTETEKDCDFCNFKRMTGVDELGRHKTKDTVRVSNTFKVEAWHTMVITMTHHPINISREVTMNLFKDALTWVYEVSQQDHQYIYTNVAWDFLHHAGASQIHPHLHMMMSPDHYYGSLELLRSAAQRYFNKYGENYFNVFLEVHAALGLVVEYGDAVAIATLSGKADLEVMFLSDFPGNDLYRLIYYTFNAFHDSFKQLCKSMVGAWPPLGTSKDASVGRIPAIVRLISRGDCTSLRTDYSSFEIFQIVYRSHDPWKVAEAIRKAITKYDH